MKHFLNQDNLLNLALRFEGEKKEKGLFLTEFIFSDKVKTCVTKNLHKASLDEAIVFDFLKYRDSSCELDEECIIKFLYNEDLSEKTIIVHGLEFAMLLNSEDMKSIGRGDDVVKKISIRNLIRRQNLLKLMISILSSKNYSTNLFLLSVSGEENIGNPTILQTSRFSPIVEKFGGSRIYVGRKDFFYNSNREYVEKLNLDIGKIDYNGKKNNGVPFLVDAKGFYGNHSEISSYLSPLITRIAKSQETKQRTLVSQFEEYILDFVCNDRSLLSHSLGYIPTGLGKDKLSLSNLEERYFDTDKVNYLIKKISQLLKRDSNDERFWRFFEVYKDLRLSEEYKRDEFLKVCTN